MVRKKTTTRKKAKTPPEKIVYMLRTCGPNGEAHNGFVYPLKVGKAVTCPDWDGDPARECGGGLHGLPNGIGNAELITEGCGRWWQVWAVKESDSRPLIKGKSRWRTGKLLFSQQANETTEAREAAIAFLAARCPRVGIVWDKVQAGDSGQATAGDSGQATCGVYGLIVIQYYDSEKGVYRRKAGEVGVGDGSDGLLLANTWYRLNEKNEFEIVKK